ncbi:hypothetical protein NQ317_007939 [Molorchus minor]|uniref:Uncharacterized protein n=1 Tax=Molorchus minor TaxID=1323400 RepID=A0ABQ9JRE7_9CUCU|nr:hypothetical protein NQ317_007939 [Molorchus minor]
MIVEWAQSGEYVVVNDGDRPTFVRSGRGLHLDVTLASKRIARCHISLPKTEDFYLDAKFMSLIDELANQLANISTERRIVIPPINMAVPTISVRDYLEIIPPFDGNPTTLATFMSACEQIFPLMAPNNESERIKFAMLHIRTKLIGKAAALLSARIFVTFPKNLLINLFRDQRNEESLVSDLNVMRQKSNEILHQFADRCIDIRCLLISKLTCQETPKLIADTKIDMYNKFTLRAFITGVNPQLSHLLRCRNPITIEEAIQMQNTHSSSNKITVNGLKPQDHLNNNQNVPADANGSRFESNPTFETKLSPNEPKYTVEELTTQEISTPENQYEYYTEEYGNCEPEFIDKSLEEHLYTEDGNFQAPASRYPGYESIEVHTSSNNRLPYIIIPELYAKFMLDTGSIKAFINEEIALNHFENFIEEDPFLITTPHDTSIHDYYSANIPLSKIFNIRLPTQPQNQTRDEEQTVRSINDDDVTDSVPILNSPINPKKTQIRIKTVVMNPKRTEVVKSNGSTIISTEITVNGIEKELLDLLKEWTSDKQTYYIHTDIDSTYKALCNVYTSHFHRNLTLRGWLLAAYVKVNRRTVVNVAKSIITEATTIENRFNKQIELIAAIDGKYAPNYQSFKILMVTKIRIEYIDFSKSVIDNTSSKKHQRPHEKLKHKEWGFYQTVAQQYGIETVVLFKKWGNINIKLAAASNKKIFLLSCRRLGIIPTHIINNTQNELKSLMNLTKLERSINQLQIQLENKVPNHMLTEFIRRQTIKYNIEFHKIKRTNINKLKNLEQQNFTDIKVLDNWLKNLTNIAIPPDIMTFLSLAAKFCLPPKVQDVPIKQFLADVENLISSFNDEKQNIFRAQITNILTNFIYKTSKRNSKVTIFLLKLTNSYMNILNSE